MPENGSLGGLAVDRHVWLGLVPHLDGKRRVRHLGIERFSPRTNETMLENGGLGGLAVDRHVWLRLVQHLDEQRRVRHRECVTTPHRACVFVY